MNPLITLTMFAAFFASPAHASGIEIDSGTTAWMLTSTALVLLMIPGLATVSYTHLTLPTIYSV